MPTYAGEPMIHPVTVIIGDSWSLDVTLEDEDGVAFDITGMTGVCQIRSEPGSVVVATPTVAITSAAAGQFSATLSAATTANLSPGSYRYAVRCTFADGSVRTVLEGVATVRRVAVG